MASLDLRSLTWFLLVSSSEIAAFPLDQLVRRDFKRFGELTDGAEPGLVDASLDPVDLPGAHSHLLSQLSLGQEPPFAPLA